MSRGLSWTLAGILSGFGVLFFTVWSGSDDSGSMAAIMFACAAVMFAVSDTGGRKKTACTDKAPDQTSAD